MTNEVAIEELNTLLRGQYMGIRSFEHYIHKLDDPELKNKFQHMQQEQKRNAMKIAERIQDLGGIPADDEGVSGSVHSFMHKLTISGEPENMIKDALEGMEKYGVRYSEEIVKGDLDADSRRMIEEVIDDSRRQAEQLRKLLH